MDLHEYQAKEIFRGAGIPVPPGEVARTPEEAEAIAREYGGMVVVKAQVHSGGRGKAGGVKLAKTPEEAREHAGNILGMSIKGLTVEKVLVTPAEDIDTEAYVGVLIDRATQAPTFIVSAAGGVDIEHVTFEAPDGSPLLPDNPVKRLSQTRAWYRDTLEQRVRTATEALLVQNRNLASAERLATARAERHERGLLLGQAGRGVRAALCATRRRDLRRDRPRAPARPSSRPVHARSPPCRDD